MIPRLAAKIMQLVNSALFWHARRVTSPDAAVVLLGLNTIHGIVVAGRIFDAVAQTSENQAGISALWQGSVQIGESAAAFAKKAQAPAPVVAQARLAGLLSLIGRVILLSATPTEFASVIARAAQTHSRFCESEGIIYGATQDEVSAYALGLWAFSEELIEAVAYQSQPTVLPADNRNNLVAFLHLARATHTPPGPPVVWMKQLRLTGTI